MNLLVLDYFEALYLGVDAEALPLDDAGELKPMNHVPDCPSQIIVKHYAK